ncbi:hypothetical protein JW826_01840 [Candidatus Woesearchaeota archaeon]|nr:hypothetical protein [Candidatus Woesearchaeota archaeon]
MTRYKIEFNHYEPGCGCGCTENDLNIAEQHVHKIFRFEGSEKDAMAEMERLRKDPEYFCNYGNYWNLTEEKARLVVVSGPSGVGKGPIIEAVKAMYLASEGRELPQFRVRKTKTARSVEGDEGVGLEGSGDYSAYDCRGTEQRIYWGSLDSALKNDHVIMEVFHKGLDLIKARYAGDHIDVTTVFISPLSKEELEELRSQPTGLESYLPDLMLDSLVRRAQKEGKVMTRELLAELEVRANGSIDEIKDAKRYDFVVPNNCYEADSRWGLHKLVGEPHRVVWSVYDLVTTGTSMYAIPGAKYDINT